MPSVAKVWCYFCHKSFYKERRLYNWNKKIGHNFFCSKVCEGRFRNKQRVFTCERIGCEKTFLRSPKEVSAHNYCCSSCAAIVNNEKYPKWPRRYCTECGGEFKNRDSKYCSSRCGYKHRKTHGFKYTRQQLLDFIRKYYRKNKRVPAKRELPDLINRVPHMFGSWNNGITIAGLKPNRSHDNRMYKRVMTKATDGHLCDSVSEALIDNWLTKNGIAHEREAAYPKTNHRADWALSDGRVFVEYFGLAKDSPRYDQSIRKKERLCKKSGIRLIGLYPGDLYPKVSLDAKLNNLSDSDP